MVRHVSTFSTLKHWVTSSSPPSLIKITGDINFDHELTLSGVRFGNSASASARKLTIQGDEEWPTLSQAHKPASNRTKFFVLTGGAQLKLERLHFDDGRAHGDDSNEFGEGGCIWLNESSSLKVRLLPSGRCLSGRRKMPVVGRKNLI